MLCAARTERRREGKVEPHPAARLRFALVALLSSCARSIPGPIRRLLILHATRDGAGRQGVPDAP